MRNEADVKVRIKKALTQHGWFWFMPAANGFGRAGVADIIALKDGNMMAVEVKFGGNTLTANQRVFLSGVDKHGGVALVVDETTLDSFIHALEQYSLTGEVCVDLRVLH